ncbi:tRNA(thr) (cytosine(32)-N(3))-methyltransferase [Physcia stellaris]|nr:tRNA(thr) (cytosine(32)-N(3))-methyltransferase [Physcia stellaris]
MIVLKFVVFCSLSLLFHGAIDAQSTCNFTSSKYPILIDATTESLGTGLEKGLFTSIDLVNAYVARILEVNATLHVVTELNPDALSIAAELDAERANGTTRGPLHGMPIIIKNNIANMDKMNNTAGSFALLGAKVPKDAGVAAKLRAAGAIILGKANLSQWANFRSSNSTNGWSAYGGQTLGVYFPQQDPSGSSSGSGVSSALGLALASLGTETSGSILSPSEVSNLVGIKPTVGLTSRALVIPISQRQDTVGPMARTVRDAAYLLQAIAGRDPDDNYTSAIPFDVLPDYVGACNYSSLRGKRFGIPRNIIYDEPGDEPVLAAFEAAVQLIKRAGGIIIDNTNITAYALDQYFNGNASSIVLDADFVSDLPGEYLSKLTYNPQNVQDLADLSNFTHEYAPEDYPDRNTAVWDESLALGYGNTDPRFWAAYQINLETAGPQGILGLLANYTLDALIVPTDFSPGLPALVGFGLSFIGRAWSEADLIGYAYAFEQRTMVRNLVQPYLVPTTELVNVVGMQTPNVTVPDVVRVSTDDSTQEDFGTVPMIWLNPDVLDDLPRLLRTITILI